MAHGVPNKVECCLPANSGVTRSSDTAHRFVKSLAGNMFTKLIKPRKKRKLETFNESSNVELRPCSDCQPKLDF